MVGGFSPVSHPSSVDLLTASLCAARSGSSSADSRAQTMTAGVMAIRSDALIADPLAASLGNLVDLQNFIAVVVDDFHCDPSRGRWCEWSGLRRVQRGPGFFVEVGVQ